MTVKEYFRQAYRLDQRIDSDIEELGRLRELAVKLGAPKTTGRIQASQTSDAAFTRAVEKIIEFEDRINKEIDTFVDFKTELRGVIDAVEDANEAMVLRYRYLHCYEWKKICKELHTKERTVLRWHGDALAHAVLPPNPTKIKNFKNF